jgi:hypothetical protein
MAVVILAFLLTISANTARSDEPVLDYCSSVRDSSVTGEGCPDRLSFPEPLPFLSFSSRLADWYVEADALALGRTSGRNRPLVVASDSGRTMLGKGDLDLGFQFGPRLLVGNRNGIDQAWELTYFGWHTWTATAARDDENNLDISGTMLGVAEDFTAADRMAIGYSAWLHNVEFNLVRDHATWSTLAGLRYIRLADELVLTSSDSDSGTSDYTVQSRNGLIGGQLGLRTERFLDRWSWQLTLKAGLYGSFLAQDQLWLDNGNTFILRHASAQSGSVAFAGDIGMVVCYQLSDRWALRGGYFAMVVSGVANAFDQLDFDNLATSGHSVSRSGLFLHGASLGFEARW